MAKEVVSGVYDLPMSIVHSYLVVTDEVVLIDSGGQNGYCKKSLVTVTTLPALGTSSSRIIMWITPVARRT